MLRSLLVAVLLQLALAPLCTAQTAPSSPPVETLDELETAIVTGVRPGPALWKVSNRGRTLWILPVFGPLPDRLVWRSSQVEKVVLESQEVYLGGRWIDDQVSDSDKRARRALGNEDGKILRDVLPPDLYRQFSELSRRYADGSARFERLRPFYAAEQLRDVAMARLKLASDGGVVQSVRNLARSLGVKVLAARAIRTRQRDRIIAQLEKTPRDADIACVREMLDRLDTDLRESIERANAWSRGDMATLRGDPGIGNAARYREACKQFFQHVKLAKEQDAAVRKTMYSAYVRALRKNRSTLALVSISDLFDADGLVAKFRKAGYKVEEPGVPAEKAQ